MNLCFARNYFESNFRASFLSLLIRKLLQVLLLLCFETFIFQDKKMFDAYRGEEARTKSGEGNLSLNEMM